MATAARADRAAVHAGEKPTDIATAIGALGNRVMIKSSELTPHFAALLKDVVAAKFAPDEMVIDLARKSEKPRGGTWIASELTPPAMVVFA